MNPKLNELCFLSYMTPADLASWVQAVGSILAIIAGFVVVYVQHRISTRHQLRQKLASTAALSRRARDLLNSLYEAFRAGEKAAKDFALAYNSDELRLNALGLEAIPLHELPDYEAMQRLLRLRSVVKESIRPVLAARNGFDRSEQWTGAVNALKASLDDVSELDTQAQEALQSAGGSAAKN